MGERLRVDPNERVDLLDFSHGTNNIIIEEMARFWRAFALQNPASAPDAFRILTGLNVTNPAGHTIRVTFTGSRFFANEIRDGVDHFGFLAESETGNPATQDFDFSDVLVTPDGDYDIYVRHFTQAGQAGNRVLWNADTGAEENATVNTRDLPRLQATYVANGAPNPYSNAGIKVADVNKVGAVYTIVANRRYFFEGFADQTIGAGAAAVGPTYTAFAYEPRWGLDATDENTDRAANGITDLYTFVQYCRRQIGEIIGMGLAGAVTNPLRPWDRVPNEVPSLADLRVEHYERGTADAGRHKNIIIRGPLNTTLTFDPTAAVPDGSVSWDGAWMTFSEPGLAGVLMRLDGVNPVAVGIQSAAGDNLVAGEQAELHFGRVFDANGKDFRLIAAGAAADNDRELRFVAKTAAGVPEVEARATGNGAFGVRGQFGYVDAIGAVAARTGRLALHASKFEVDDGTVLGAAPSTNVKYETSAGDGRWVFDHAAGFMYLSAAIDLPQGAVITQIDVRVDPDNVNPHTFSIELRALDLGSAGVDVTIASLESSVGSADQIVTLDAATVPTPLTPPPLPWPPPVPPTSYVDKTSNHAYLLLVQVQSTGAPVTWSRFYGAIVTYTFDDLRGD